jgi:hypothetical protein
MQGLKISMGMHNFGEKRWGSGILDDIRSQNDRNTRIIGDFTKMVRSAPVARKMHEYVTDKKDRNWQIHFAQLVEKSDFPELQSVVPKIQYACAQLASAASTFKRTTLQTRFFETGDNYYLGKSSLLLRAFFSLRTGRAHIEMPRLIPLRNGAHARV